MIPEKKMFTKICRVTFFPSVDKLDPGLSEKCSPRKKWNLCWGLVGLLKKRILSFL